MSAVLRECDVRYMLGEKKRKGEEVEGRKRQEMREEYGYVACFV